MGEFHSVIKIKSRIKLKNLGLKVHQIHFSIEWINMTLT